MKTSSFLFRPASAGTGSGVFFLNFALCLGQPQHFAIFFQFLNQRSLRLKLGRVCRELASEERPHSRLEGAVVAAAAVVALEEERERVLPGPVCRELLDNASTAAGNDS